MLYNITKTLHDSSMTDVYSGKYFLEILIKHKPEIHIIITLNTTVIIRIDFL